MKSPLSGSARRTYWAQAIASRCREPSGRGICAFTMDIPMGRSRWRMGQVPAVRLGSPDLLDAMREVPAVRLGSPDLLGAGDRK